MYGSKAEKSVTPKDREYSPFCKEYCEEDGGKSRKKYQMLAKMAVIETGCISPITSSQNDRGAGNH